MKFDCIIGNVNNQKLHRNELTFHFECQPADRQKKTLEDNLTSAREGLVKGRMDAVEAGNASDISTVENRTQFRQTNPPL